MEIHEIIQHAPFKIDFSRCFALELFAFLEFRHFFFLVIIIIVPLLFSPARAKRAIEVEQTKEMIHVDDDEAEYHYYDDLESTPLGALKVRRNWRMMID